VTVPPSSGSLRRRLYLLAFVDEFGPVYAVFTLWFNDNGISTSQISTVFLLWAAIALALEIPSGALADRVDRRRLLAAAFGIRAVGISLWFVWPTFAGVLIGAALWATHSAMASGAWEALIHDELTAIGEERHYPKVIARISQFSNLGVAAGTMLGAGLLQLDVGLSTLGWLTVAAHAGSITLVTLLPDVRWVTRSHDHDDNETAHTSSYAAWWATLRQGVTQARRTPLVAKIVVLGAMQEGLFLIDDYLPLVARDRGGIDANVPIIVFFVWVGLLCGSELSARRPDLRSRTLGSMVIAGSGVMAVALLSDRLWPLVLIAIGYGSLEAAWIATDARLQERAPSETRATVTSVRGFGSASIAMVAFVMIGLMSDGDDPTPGLLVALAATTLVGSLFIRWMPEYQGRHQANR
jgi:MFS family permease